jgi:DNA-binding NarL/FixJ family response regulator
MRDGSRNNKKYGKEYPYDFQTFEENAGANKHDNEILSKITYEPFKNFLGELDFMEKVKQLPKRTHKIIDLILEGYTQHDISYILQLSTRTIKREYSKLKIWLKSYTI